MVRRVVAVVAPALAAVVGCWWFVAANRDRLPPEIATHWDLSGTPDRFASLDSFLTTVGILAAISWLVAGVLALTLGPHLREFSWLVTGAPGAVAGFSATIVVITVLANRDSAGLDAQLAPWVANVTVFGLLAGGLIGAAAAGPVDRPPTVPAAGDERQSAQGAADTLTVTLTWNGARWLALALAIGGLVVAALSQIVIVIVLAPIVLALARYHLTIDATGVHVRGGLFGWPSLTIPLTEIRAARITQVRVWEWGGWGLRVRLHGSRGLITRSGAGIELELEGGREFVATVDDPDHVVAAIQLLRGDRSARY